MIKSLNLMSFELQLNLGSDAFTSPMCNAKKHRKMNRGSDENKQDDGYVPTCAYSRLVDENVHDVKSQPNIILTSK